MDLPFSPQPKELTRVPRRKAKARAEESEQDAVYRLVNLRDDNRCRCCGRRVEWPSKAIERRREHHHLRTRATSTTVEKHTTANVHVVDGWCHQLITAGKIAIIGRNCNRPLAFRWTAFATKAERDAVRMVLRDERRVA
jgi:hypothetical protein